jgi:hypothetical protein
LKRQDEEVGVDKELFCGGAYVNLVDDTKLAYRVDPGGESVELVALGPMELSIGMTPQVLERCQAVLAEALRVAREAKSEFEDSSDR